MLIGSKSLSDMSDAELLEAIEELQSNREALRADAIKKHADAKAKGAPAPRIASAPREPKEASNNAKWLEFLKGDDDVDVAKPVVKSWGERLKK